jgi:RNA-binding protein YlmH
MEELYQHFRKEEHAFIDQARAWKTQVELTYSLKLTDFLDPREQFILKSVFGSTSESKLSFSGGQDFAERKRAILYPQYVTLTEEDYRIVVYEIKYPSKFISIEHRDVLGSTMALGLKRTKFGDIFVEDKRVQLVIAAEISEFVQRELTSIGKAPVTLQKIDMTDVIEGKDNWERKTGTVSSLRLDVIVAEAYSLSRQKVQPFIQNGGVKVNWKVIENPAYECKFNDIISTRGFGRCKLLSIEGKTKKEKWRITYGIQK